MTLGTSDTLEPEASTARIVVGIDGSDASINALDWAARQANLTHSILDMIVTWEWPTNYGWGVYLPEDYSPSGGAPDLLSKVADGLRAKYPDMEMTTRVVEGHPSPALVDASKGADLLVVGSRGHGEFVGMLIGSVSEYCATHAHCPVLVHRTAQ